MTNTHRILSAIATRPQGDPGPHLTNEQFIAYANSSLPQDQLQACEQHLDHCAECCKIVERLAEAEAQKDAPLPFPVFVPELSAILKHRSSQHQRTPGPSRGLALAAASEKTLPDVLSVDGLLPGFTGYASGDGCTPSLTSILTLAHTAAESPRPSGVPSQVLAVWPTGQTAPHPATYRGGRWRLDIKLPIPWPDLHALISSNSVQIVIV